MISKVFFAASVAALAISGSAIIIAVALNAQANRDKGRIILKRAEHAT